MELGARKLSRIAGVLVVSVLSGCAGLWQSQAPVGRGNPAVAMESQIANLLVAAERNLARDQLMRPYGNNAYDRFKAVLQLSPGHPQALSGLQQIQIRYVELGRKALASNKLSKAKVMLARARQLDGSNALVDELQVAITEAATRSASPKGASEYALAPADLQARNHRIKTVLQEVAERVRGSGESVLLVARSDAEGRWLYQELRKAASGYRVRGDIRIEATPRIVLLPPIR